MATWQEVKQYIYSNYQVSEDTGGYLTLVLKTTFGRSQLVHLACGEGSPYISVLSPIGPVSDIDGNRLLALSSTERRWASAIVTSASGSWATTWRGHP